VKIITPSLHTLKIAFDHPWLFYYRLSKTSPLSNIKQSCFTYIPREKIIDPEKMSFYSWPLDSFIYSFNKDVLFTPLLHFALWELVTVSILWFWLRLFPIDWITRVHVEWKERRSLILWRVNTPIKLDFHWMNTTTTYDYNLSHL